MWQTKAEKTYELDDLIMFKVNKDMRPKPYSKFITTRDGSKLRFMTNYQNQYVYLFPVSHSDSIALIEGDTEQLTDEYFATTAKTLARHSKEKSESSVTIGIQTKHIRYNVAIASFTDNSEVHKWFI